MDSASPIGKPCIVHYYIDNNDIGNGETPLRQEQWDGLVVPESGLETHPRYKNTSKCKNEEKNLAFRRISRIRN